MPIENAFQDIQGALRIDGFMFPSELLWLSQQAKLHSKIVEIGSLYGRSTRALADNTQGFVVAIDDWKGPRDATMSWKDRQVIYEKFSQNLKEHIDSGKVIPWRVDHDALANGEAIFSGAVNINTKNGTQPTKFDMCFIDGDHVYKSVLRDIKVGFSLLKDGGLLCGHDYEISRPNVIQAVNESCGEPGFIPQTSIWWVEKKAEVAS